MSTEKTRKLNNGFAPSPINRCDLHPSYKPMMKLESHHDHVIEDVGGKPRWRENPEVAELVDRVGLNDIITLFIMLGNDKNSEIWRQLYRDIGYSLDGYYSVFYWSLNNEDAHLYKQPKVKRVKLSITLKKLAIKLGRGSYSALKTAINPKSWAVVIELLGIMVMTLIYKITRLGKNR